MRIFPALLLRSFAPACGFVVAALGMTIHAAPVSFSKDIAPILADKCQTCHQEGKDKGSYRVDTFAALHVAGDTDSAPLVPGKPDEGEFFYRLITEDEDERMPQKDDPLPKEQIELFRRWIAEGAKFDGKNKDQSLASLLPKSGEASSPEKYPQPLPVTALQWLPDQQTIVVSGYREVTLWDSQSGALKKRVGGLPERIFAISLHPNGKTLAVAGGVPGRSGEVMMVDLEQGKTIKSLPPANDAQLAVAFSPNGEWLAYGGTGNAVHLLQTKDWKQVWKADAHADWVVQLAFAPDNKHLASASRDRTARVFDIASPDAIVTQTTHGNPVNSVLFSPDGKRLYTAANNGEVRFCELSAAVNGSGQIASSVVTGRRLEATRLALLNQHLFIAAVDGRLRGFDVSKKKDDKPLDLPGFKHRIDALALSPDGKKMAVAGVNGQVQIIDINEKKVVKNFTASPGWAAQ